MLDGRLLAPYADLEAYVAAGGGSGLAAALELGPNGVVEHLEAAGLRGRGGAGFPTGRKWRTVIGHGSSSVPATVVVNAAEGEPGSFKDRAILRADPYRVLEGAVAAARTVGADRVIVATKASFTRELARLRQAAGEVERAGWLEGLSLEVFAGPGEYLFGEETALLEVLDGRPPFPRIAPPYRHGVDEVSDGDASAADVDLAGTGSDTVAPPTLVNNAETLAHVPGVLANGPDWFREAGTAGSPGTTVFTVTGSTRHHGVRELPLGIPLREVVRQVGGGPRAGRRLVALLPGVAHPLIPAHQLDTPASYEDLESIGSGLGAAGFIVFDDADDLVAVARGVSRFLAVESCGQCTPCKQDGLALSQLLGTLCEGGADEATVEQLAERAATVADEARCFLAHQHQRVVESVLEFFPAELKSRLGPRATPVAPVLVSPIVDLVAGRATLDEAQAAKQPDWTLDGDDSGQAPAERMDRGAGEGA